MYGTIIADGTGDMLINQLMGSIVVKNPNQKVWVRSFNGEGVIDKPTDTANVKVTAGQAWLMGYKSEGEWVKAECSGGFLEMFSVLQYGGSDGQQLPLFRVSGNAQFILGMLTQVTHAVPPWQKLVSETRNGTERVLTNTLNPYGYNMSLYTGYDAGSIPWPVETVHPQTRPDPLPRGSSIRLAGNRLLVAPGPDGPSPVDVRVTGMRGRSQTLLRRGSTISGADA